MCKGLATLPATCLKSAKNIRNKIGFLLQRPGPQAADQKHVKDKIVTGKRVVGAAEVKKWKESFNQLMNSDFGRELFTGFLRSEFSEENMEFWNACQEYNKSPPRKMAGRAKLIYHQYIEEDAPNQVNLDSATRAEAGRNLRIASLSCFDDAQSKIYVLMEKDSYRRFLTSKLMQTASAKAEAPLKNKGKESGCVMQDGQTPTSSASS